MAATAQGVSDAVLVAVRNLKTYYGLRGSFRQRLLGGEAGRSYQLQSSPNFGLYFANSGVPQIANVAGQVEFIDPLPPTPRQYYRAFAAP